MVPQDRLSAGDEQDARRDPWKAGDRVYNGSPIDDQSLALGLVVCLHGGQDVPKISYSLSSKQRSQSQ